MLNNKEPFLFFASIPPYTKLVILIGLAKLPPNDQIQKNVKTLIRRIFGGSPNTKDGEKKNKKQKLIKTLTRRIFEEAQAKYKI